MNAIPLSLAEANAFVEHNHRHHKLVHRDKFRIGAVSEGHLIGVVQVARPVSRMLDDGETVEVVRLCTDGTKNACSFLYARAAKVAALMGFKRIVTYILETESGCSLAASGWHCDKEQAGGGSWSRPSRPRESTAPLCAKRRYVKELR